MMEFIGKAEYDNHGNDFFIEWATVGGKSFVEMLDEAVRDGWRGERVRVTIEAL